MPSQVSTTWFITGLLDVLGEKVVYRRDADRALSEFGEGEGELAVEKCFELAAAEERFLISSNRAHLLKRRSNQGPVTTSTTRSVTAGNASQGVPAAEAKDTRSASATSRGWRQGTSQSTNRQASGSDSKFDHVANIQRKFQLTKEQVQTDWDKQACFICHKVGHMADKCRSKNAALNNMFSSLSDSSEDEDDKQDPKK